MVNNENNIDEIKRLRSVSFLCEENREQEVNNLKCDIFLLKNKIINLESNIDNLNNDMNNLKENFFSIKNSTMWKITFPARRLLSLLPKNIRSDINDFPKKILHKWCKKEPYNHEIGENNTIKNQDHQKDNGRYALLKYIPTIENNYFLALEWYDPIKPDVSIVILNWHRVDMTLLCLSYLWNNTKGYTYEIIIVDNGSSEDEIDKLKRNAHLSKIISLKINRYYGEANNIGVENSNGKYICFLNNDTFVSYDWLKPLIDPLESDNYVGATGPKFLFPDGILQEAGAFIYADGNVLRIGRNDPNPDNPIYNKERVVDYISGACLVVRRNDFLRVLGFDLAWDPAYYEDPDLCLKLKILGLKTLYIPNSKVVHIERATSTDSTFGPRLRDVVDINKKKFVTRWKDFISSNGKIVPNIITPSYSISKSTKLYPKIAIFTPHNITPGGGERYIFTLIESLKDKAHVTLITKRKFSFIRILTIGRELGLNLNHIQLYSLDELSEHENFDIFFVLCNHIYPELPALGKHNIIICQFPFPLNDHSYVSKIKPYWNEYESILVYSEFVKVNVDKVIDEEHISKKPIKIINPPVPIMKVRNKRKSRIISVGRFFEGKHCKRHDVLIRSFKELSKTNKEAELHLAGSLHPEPQHRQYLDNLLKDAEGFPIFFHINISYEQIEKLYGTSEIYWHAAGFGIDSLREAEKAEHFGIAIVEAMSAGCIPIVYNAGGAKDLIIENKTGFYFSTTEELIEKTRIIIDNIDSSNIKKIIENDILEAKKYNQEEFKNNISNYINEILGN